MVSVSKAEPIYFIDEVNETSVERLMEAIKKALKNSDKDVEVIFSTLGGKHHVALGFFWWVQRLTQKNRIRAVASGQLASAGLTMFLAFDRRSADPTSQVQFHKLSTFAKRMGSGEIMLDLIKESEKQLVDLVTSRTKLSAEESRELLEQESWIINEDLVLWGFVNE